MYGSPSLAEGLTFRPEHVCTLSILPDSSYYVPRQTWCGCKVGSADMDRTPQGIHADNDCHAFETISILNRPYCAPSCKRKI